MRTCGVDKLTVRIREVRKRGKIRVADLTLGKKKKIAIKKTIINTLTFIKMSTFFDQYLLSTCNINNYQRLLTVIRCMYIT